MFKKVVFVGLDLAKNLYALDSQILPVVRRQTRRTEVLKFLGKLPSSNVGTESFASVYHRAAIRAELPGGGQRTYPASQSFLQI